jgi:hypothetical protein
MFCAGGALVCFVILALGAWMQPSPAGVGTHEQLGLRACGWLAATGKPCPTCGMTTAVSWAAHGDLVRSFWVQPGGMAFALALAVLFWPLLWSGLTGSRVITMVAKLLRPRALWIGAAVWGASWAYKVATWPG